MLQSTAPPAAWNLSMGQGSSAEYALTFTDADGDPYPFSDTTWEYVVRSVTGGNAVITLTTSPSDDGSLSITATEELSQVTVNLNPAATSGLARGMYAHALWMNPGTASAYLWLTGTFALSLAPQP